MNRASITSAWNGGTSIGYTDSSNGPGYHLSAIQIEEVPEPTPVPTPQPTPVPTTPQPTPAPTPPQPTPAPLSGCSECMSLCREACNYEEENATNRCYGGGGGDGDGSGP